MGLVSELSAQIKTMQREEGGTSELAAQHIVEPRVTPPFFRRISQERIRGLGIRKVSRGLTKEHGLRQIL